MNYKVGIYLRLSREDERLGESGSISNQRDLLLNYIKDNNLTLVSEYVDDGVSGTTFDRDGFRCMIKDCESKKINMIITKDTSRLGRDHIEFGFYVERYFPEHNIRYVAVNDGIDTFKNTSANDMLVFKSAFNDMYVKDISNKLRSSLYTKKRKGCFVGAYAPYGYNKDTLDKHKLVINENEAAVVRRIFRMFINGISINKICDILTKDGIKTPSISKNMNIGLSNYHYGIWSLRTVSDILKNEVYIGNLIQCKQRKVNYKSKKRVRNSKDDFIVVNNVVPRIIDDYTFTLACNMFKSNKNRSLTNNITSTLLLRGLIYCKECGHTIGFRSQKQLTKKYGEVIRIYGNCNYWSKRKKLGKCSPHSVKYSDIEFNVLSNLKSIINKYIDSDRFKEVISKININSKKRDSLNKIIKRIDNEISLINKKCDACYNDKLNGTITLDMYKRIYNNLLLEFNKLENDKKRFIDEIDNINSNNRDIDYDIIIDKFINLNNTDRSFITTLIDRIDISEDNTIDIYYKFNINNKSA